MWLDWRMHLSRIEVHIEFLYVFARSTTHKARSHNNSKVRKNRLKSGNQLWFLPSFPMGIVPWSAYAPNEKKNIIESIGSNCNIVDMVTAAASQRLKLQATWFPNDVGIRHNLMPAGASRNQVTPDIIIFVSFPRESNAVRSINTVLQIWSLQSDRLSFLRQLTWGGTYRAAAYQGSNPTMVDRGQHPTILEITELNFSTLQQ